MEHMLFSGKTGNFQVVIGLEVHAQILTHSKLFSGASSQVFGAQPNTHVSFHDAGFPGMLPVVNEWCVYQGIKTGLGVQGQINLVSVFERKNYFYPDNPSGYQISQYKHPLVENGVLTIGTPPTQKTIRIQRIHLEQDAGKNIHDKDPHHSYVDFNRAGIGLMEIVTHPDLNTPDEAIAYIKRLRSLLRYLGTCDGNMEQGNLRVDANVSVRRPGQPLGTRVELKNMNSLRFLNQALIYEIHRQIQCLEEGQRIIQETRAYDVAEGVTRPLREKEEAEDYRYFPDPDLPPLVLTEAVVENIRRSLPELPDQKFQRFMDHWSLSAYDAQLLTEEREVADFFDQTAALLPHGEAWKLAANWITGEIFAALNRDHLAITACPITPTHLAALIQSLLANDLSSTLAKEVFAHMWQTGQHPHTLMDEKGLRQVSDESQIFTWIDAVIHREAAQVAQYLAGKEKILGSLVGQLMKESQGKCNPRIAQELLRQRLEALRHPSA